MAKATRKPRVKRHWTRQLDKLDACEMAIRFFRRFDTVGDAADYLLEGRSADWRRDVGWFAWFVGAMSGDHLTMTASASILLTSSFPTHGLSEDLRQAVRRHRELYGDVYVPNMTTAPWKVVRDDCGRRVVVKRRVDLPEGG